MLRALYTVYSPSEQEIVLMHLLLSQSLSDTVSNHTIAKPPNPSLQRLSKEGLLVLQSILKVVGLLHQSSRGILGTIFLSTSLPPLS